MARNYSNRNVMIRRRNILKALGLDARLSAGLRHEFKDVDITVGWNDVDMIRADMIVKAREDVITHVGDRQNRHRIFIRCACGCEIPFGRFAQHRGACHQRLNMSPNYHYMLHYHIRGNTDENNNLISYKTSLTAPSPEIACRRLAYAIANSYDIQAHPYQPER